MYDHKIMKNFFLVFVYILFLPYFGNDLYRITSHSMDIVRKTILPLLYFFVFYNANRSGIIMSLVPD